MLPCPRKKKCIRVLAFRRHHLLGVPIGKSECSGYFTIRRFMRSGFEQDQIVARPRSARPNEIKSI